MCPAGPNRARRGRRLPDFFRTVTVCVSTLIGFGPRWELSFSKEMREVPAGVGCESQQEHDPPEH